MLFYMPSKTWRRRQPLLIALLMTTLVYYCYRPSHLHETRGIQRKFNEARFRDLYPLTWQHIYRSKTKGGAWYIPPSWLQDSGSSNQPNDILEAAHLASKLAEKASHTIPYSTIPLIIHQTWKNTRVGSWPTEVTQGIEKWLQYATTPGHEMAYFFWLDDGCSMLMDKHAPTIVESLAALPLPVERSDVFRVVVTNSIGGVYGDVDTLPLRAPTSWIEQSDIEPWLDPKSQTYYGVSKIESANSEKPIRILLGIEADNEPNTDTFWRMGYTFPVQLTQWALAAAPNHPILNQFLSAFASRMAELALPYRGNVTLAGQRGAYKHEDPLRLTGPVAITVATMSWLEQENGLRWNAVTGLHDGGRSKAVGDTVILPITAFSPGRGRYGNMGSKPITDPSARVLHHAQGSWREFDLRVELGKLCRTALGMCRDVSKVPT